LELGFQASVMALATNRAPSVPMESIGKRKKVLRFGAEVVSEKIHASVNNF